MTFIVGKRERAMLRLAVDQFIRRTEWCDHATHQEWLDLLDELRWHHPGDDYTVLVELMTEEQLGRLALEMTFEHARREKEKNKKTQSESTP